jgi:hypothetical protein
MSARLSAVQAELLDAIRHRGVLVLYIRQSGRTEPHVYRDDGKRVNILTAAKLERLGLIKRDEQNRYRVVSP